MQREVEIEKIYQKKTQLEHILLRPDTYIGSIERTDATLWILEEGKEKFTNKQIEYVPGLYKIFDEILVNAADNYQRDHSMDTIKVKIDEEKGFISVWNNGAGIPVQIHKEYNIYVPEMIFGHLLTSSNYDDTQKKVTGGRNGYGAKLTNIFSKKFTVETADSKNKKQFKMTWKNNMSSASSPEINPFSGEDWTCVSFEPDLKRFGMDKLDRDTIALMRKRVYDLAGVISSSVRVYLNGKKIDVRGFSNYVDMYLDEGDPKIKKEKKGEKDRWEVIVSVSDGQFQQVSFVNSICTSKGGTHVNYVTDQIVNELLEVIKKKHKDLNIKPFQVKNHLWVFVNSLIENPSFDSQTKETLTLKVQNFGSACELSDKFLKEIAKSGIIDTIVAQAKAKSDAKLAKALNGSKKSRLLGIPKLEDANDAGTRNAEHCTLILTEGDSAKSLAMAGVEVVGRDRYGVFPLKGKLLNVREATNKQILDNQEIQNIIKILGLQVGKTYNDLKSLRYGSLMIMADQDHDGSHIKGLIVNFIHHYWPSLIRTDGFLKQFITPIIKATKGTQTKTFFTIQDYKRWADDPNSRAKTWKIKYYKGLGTSTDKEAKEYFTAIDKHQIDFEYQDQADDESIDLVFSKKKIEARKDWLKDYDPDAEIDYSQSAIRYYDFVHRELIHFSNSDNVRSIPSICDGFKPGQRKILYACFKRNLKDEIKVAQLAGYVAEHSAYHHGEQSLSQTIVGLAQNFVGSNNINLLMPNGQFGSRAAGGKDSASARYIFTNLSRVTRSLFNENDDHLYKYLEDDGQSVEPEWYLPIIPMILVNGAEGIGTGWSTNIPCFNPVELVENIKSKLRGEEFKDMDPWFKGYEGIIEKSSKGGYVIKGKYHISNEEDDTIVITELPVRRWTKDYKQFLDTMLNPEEGEPELEDIKEYHANNRVHFVVKLKPGILDKCRDGDGIEKKFKLSTTMQTTNMVLFNHERKLKRYQAVPEILEEFYQVRLKFYNNRKEYLMSRLQRDIEILSNKKRFILAVISEDLNIRNVKKKDLVQTLLKKCFVPMKKMTKVKSTKKQEKEKEEKEGDEPVEEEEGLEVPSSEFNYLLQMPLWNLTYEKVEALKEELAKKEAELAELRATTIETMWTRDLDEFLTILKQVEAEEEEERLKGGKMKGKGGNGKKKVTTNTTRKKKNDDYDFFSDSDFKPKRGNSQNKEKAKPNKAQTANFESKERNKSAGKDKPLTQGDPPKKPAPKKNEEANKENKVQKKEPSTSSNSSTTNQSSKSSDFNSSILKYLSKSSTTNTLTTSSQNADGYVPLSQRIYMREQQGSTSDVDPFKKTYESIKTSQPSQVLDPPKKRKAMDEDDDDIFTVQSRRVKKATLIDDDYKPNETTDGKSSATGLASAQRRKKLMIESDDEQNTDYKWNNSTNKKPDTSVKANSSYKFETSNKGGSTDGKGSALGGTTTLRKKKKVNYKVDSTGTKDGDDDWEDVNENDDDSDFDYDTYKNLSQYFN